MGVRWNREQQMDIAILLRNWKDQQFITRSQHKIMIEQWVTMFQHDDPEFDLDWFRRIAN